MSDLAAVDYSRLDIPEVLMVLFHPRREWEVPASGSRFGDVLIPVDEGVSIGGRFHVTEKSNPNILFFHGNGEIVSDYDDLGPLYNRLGINFLAVDYRGYGRSTGKPTVSSMMRDCHAIYDYVKNWLNENGCTGPLIVMGRSLGSASAIELAASHPDGIGGLVVESGFAYSGPLLKLLGADVKSLGQGQEDEFGNLAKIRKIGKPLLVIHAERDHIIPFSDGQALYEASPSADKTILKIPGANHNDIFARGLSEYMAMMKSFTVRLPAR